MLNNAPVMITFSVNDLAAAKEFYGEKLGLSVSEDYPGMLTLKLKDSTVSIYEKKDTHKAASYTLLNFTVENIEESIKELTQKRVVFEQYDLPDLKTDAAGIVDYGMMKIAFFNDPAGNNHAILQMTS